MGKTFKAISIRQPFAELIIRGIKMLEFRSRPTKFVGTVAVYATKKPVDSDVVAAAAKKIKGFDKIDFPQGKIVGYVDISGCEYSDDDECYAYFLDNPRREKVPFVPNGTPQPLFWNASKP